MEILLCMNDVATGNYLQILFHSSDVSGKDESPKLSIKVWSPSSQSYPEGR